jgi:heterodisulfide reductase subunit B
MKYLYYPGCSLKESGKSYDESLQSVFREIDIHTEELPDWNCCGATSYMSIDENKAYALTARNLAIAEQQSNGEPFVDVITPCNACYLGLSKVQHYLEEFEDISDKVSSALRKAGLEYTGKVRIRHPIDVLVNDVGLDALSAHVKKSLKGIKVACYYGCQMVRPYATFDDQENPMTMDRLIQALGAETLDWPLKTRCCGGTFTGTIQDIGLELNYVLLKEAKQRGADVIATNCSLCQFNLECYQNKIHRKFKDHEYLPVVYFTQLIGMALGLPKKDLGLHRLFIPFKLK